MFIISMWGYYNMFRTNGTIFRVYIYPKLLMRYTYVNLFLFVLTVLVSGLLPPSENSVSVIIIIIIIIILMIVLH